MKSLILLPALFFLLTFSKSTRHNNLRSVNNTIDTIPFMFGDFTDDYGIHYRVNDSLWTQLPIIKYHIINWNKKEQYFIARNDENNPSEPGLYTRIDYMPFNDMKPWLWGFCYTVYKAKDDKEAEQTVAADRSNPRKGCNGFPFSRMMKTE